MKLFVYGTLKQGHANHHAYGMHKQRLLESSDSARGEMRDLGLFPALFAGNEIVRGEVYELIDMKQLHCVIMMETKAGYIIEKIKTDKGHDCFVFIYPDSYRKLFGFDQCPIITEWTLEMENIAYDTQRLRSE